MAFNAVFIWLIGFFLWKVKVLANSNLYFTGSGGPHNKLELHWKILADVKLPLLSYTQEAKQPFLVFYPCPLPSPMYPKTTYMKNRDFLPEAFFLTVGAWLVHAQHKLNMPESWCSQRHPSTNDGQVMGKDPSSLTFGVEWLWRMSSMQSCSCCLLGNEPHVDHLPCLVSLPHSSANISWDHLLINYLFTNMCFNPREYSVSQEKTVKIIF